MARFSNRFRYESGDSHALTNTYLQRFVIDGGFMMIFLIPTSLLAVAGIIRGFLRLRRERVAPSALLDAAKNLHDAQDARSFQELLARNGSALARLAIHLLRLGVVSDNPKAEEEENDFLRLALNDEIDRLWQETTGLATIYSVAPLMGLLGTITGLMRTFYEFTNNPEHNVESLSRGINEALVTTMWGLAIAIPAYLFVQIFRGRIFHYEKDLLPHTAKDLARAVWHQQSSKTGRS